MCGPYQCNPLWDSQRSPKPVNTLRKMYDATTGSSCRSPERRLNGSMVVMHAVTTRQVWCLRHVNYIRGLKRREQSFLSKQMSLSQIILT